MDTKISKVPPTVYLELNRNLFFFFKDFPKTKTKNKQLAVSRPTSYLNERPPKYKRMYGIFSSVGCSSKRPFMVGRTGMNFCRLRVPLRGVKVHAFKSDLINNGIDAKILNEVKIEEFGKCLLD